MAALSALSSSFGLGTIIGPAVAPLFVLPLLGLAGPLFAFAAIALVVVAVDRAAGFPNDRYGRRVGRGAAMSYPSLATPPTGASVVAATAPQRRERLKWNDPRIRPWIVAGVVAGHAQAATLTCLGFFVIDRLHLDRLGLGRADLDRDDGRRGGDARRAMGTDPAAQAQPARADPVGCADRCGGPHADDAVAQNLYGITIGFALASLGFGFTRPGFTAGASLAVPLAEQGAVAGVITSANGISYVLAPALGISLYGLDHNLPFAGLRLAPARPDDRRPEPPRRLAFLAAGPRAAAFPGRTKPMPPNGRVASLFSVSWMRSYSSSISGVTDARVSPSAASKSAMVTFAGIKPARAARSDRRGARGPPGPRR